MKSVRKAIHSVWAYNLYERDIWVSSQCRQLPAGSKVLDVGAGSCPYRNQLQHCEYKTQDFQQLTSSQLRNGSYGQIDYVCDASSIPVEDASFDVIICTEVLEHILEPIKVIEEFSRILKPGGKVLLSAPLGSGIHQEPHHYYGGFTPFWYKSVLERNGFKEIQVEENRGSYAFFSQESIRFVASTKPWKLKTNVISRLLWLPIWIALSPVLAIAIPIISRTLDKYDAEKKFTVGYHIVAQKGFK